MSTVRWLVDRSRPKDRPTPRRGSTVTLTRTTLPDGRKAWNGSAYVALLPPCAHVITPKRIPGLPGTPWLGFQGPRRHAARYDLIADEPD